MSDSLEQSESPKPKSGVVRDLIIGLVTFLLVFIAGQVYWPDSPPKSMTVQRPAVSAPRSNDMLASRINKLESLVTAQHAQIVELQSTLAQLAARQPVAADDASRQELENLKTQVTALQERQEQPSGLDLPQKNMALMLAFQELEQQVTDGRGYMLALEQMKRLNKDPGLTPALSRLSSTPQGIKPLDALTADFNASAKQSYMAAQQVPENAGTWDKIKGNLSKVIVVRKTGGAAGEDADSLILRAESALKARRLEEAVTLIKKLPPAQAEAFAAWLVDAEAHRSAMQALSELRTALIDAVAHSSATL